MKALNINSIIHPFALLHVAVALTCRSLGIMDEIWLTLLTIAMLVLICLKMNTRVEMTIATVIIINFAAYMIGVYGARLLGMISDSILLVHSVSTFVTTEIIGWGTYGFLHLVRKYTSVRSVRATLPRTKILGRHAVWLVAGLLTVILFRIALTLLFSSDRSEEGNLLDTIEIFISKSGAPLLILCCIIILIRHLRIRCRHMGLAIKAAIVIAAAAILSAGAAAIAGINLQNPEEILTIRKFLQLFVVALSFFIISYSIIYLIDYVFATRAAMIAERDKADNAKFQYEQLKQQVNPHFLFNSLNILDCMVMEGQTEQASAFIHKLAGIYRYLLRNEERTVPLKKEMEFAGMYADLLKERFSDGFEVRTDAGEEYGERLVVPCSVQMLIENAIKHNTVGGETRLTIRIYTEGDFLCVTNNLLPKLSGSESTKVGLNYIRRQYMNICGKEIEIIENEKEYTVKIPVI